MNAEADEAATRAELSRQFDVCNGCRLCVDLCTVFPVLFDVIGRTADGDAGSLTPAQQNRVVDACFHCGRCVLQCPFAPGRHELAVDVPRVMLRAQAMRRATGQVPWSAATVARRAVAAVTGIPAVALARPVRRPRFSTWFDRRASLRAAGGERVTVYATCLVEYDDPAVGRDLVAVYEHNGIACDRSAAGCCGAPWLHAGDTARFRRVAGAALATLAAEIRAGATVVVAQPTCAEALHRAAAAAGQDVVDLVGALRDPATHLAARHRAGRPLRAPATVPATVTHHTSCHARAVGAGGAGADLLTLAGAAVTVVEGCAGVGGAFGLRGGTEGVTPALADRLAADAAAAAGDGGDGGNVLTGDCLLANRAVAARGGLAPVHPLSVLAGSVTMPRRPPGS